RIGTAALLPRRQQATYVLCDRPSAIEFQVVYPKGMNDPIIVTRFTDTPIPANTLTTLEFVERAVNAYKKNVERPEQRQETTHPLLRFDDVFDDQVVPGRGKRGNAAMKAVEERRPLCRPRELAAFDARHRQDICITQMVDRVMPERFRQRVL